MTSAIYKRQSAYLLFGLIGLVLPFLSWQYLALGLLIWIIFLAAMPQNLSLEFIPLSLSTLALLLSSSILGYEKFPLFIVGAAVAIATFGISAPGILNIFNQSKDMGSAKTTIIILAAGAFYVFLFGKWIAQNMRLNVPSEMVFFLAVLGALTGAFLKSISIKNDNIIIPIGSGMTMWLFYAFRYYVSTQYLTLALAFAFILGYLAYKVDVADISAMLSATLLGVLIIVYTNIKWYFILLAFFTLGIIFTKYRYDYKLTLGIAQEKEGVRDYKNVLSNSLPALVLAIAYPVFPEYGEFLLLAYLGSVATALGDTLASEIGETSQGEPRMITSLKKVPPGTDGAVSNLGELAALAGSLAIALLAISLGLIDSSLLTVTAILAGGLIGTNIDSLLGATLQQKGFLSNNSVNLLATTLGALVSVIIYGLVV